MLPRILIIDDELTQDKESKQFALKSLGLLEEKGKIVSSEEAPPNCLGLASFCSGLVDGEFKPGEAVSRVKERWKEDSDPRWSLVVVDYEFIANQRAIKGGVEIVRLIRNFREDVPLVLLSGHDPAAVERQVGSGVAFFQKPRPNDRNIPKTTRAFAEILFQNGLFEDGQMRYVDSGGRVQIFQSKRTRMVGRSLLFLKALREGRQIVQRNQDARVLIDAEKGCGKELFAAYLHEYAKVVRHYSLDAKNRSSWDNGKLVTVRVSESRGGLSIPDLLGTEQHTRKGAQVVGAIEHAEFGTLHFDEISGLQAQDFQLLLRLVEQSSFVRQGGTIPVPVRCQMLFSTNQDVDHLLERGLMPPEFYDRVDRLTIPPVSERGWDKTLLFNHFLGKHWNWNHEPKVEGDAQATIENAPWLGNVRQIQRVATIIAAQGKYRSVIRKDDIDLALRKTASAKYVPAVRSLQGLLERIHSFEVNPDENLKGVVPAIKESIGKLLTNIVECEYRRAPNRQRLVNTLTGGQMDGHAPELAIDRWIKHLGLDPSTQAVKDLQKDRPKRNEKRQK